jgi:hypothetical protein
LKNEKQNNVDLQNIFMKMRVETWFWMCPLGLPDLASQLRQKLLEFYFFEGWDFDVDICFWEYHHWELK